MEKKLSETAVIFNFGQAQIVIVFKQNNFEGRSNAFILLRPNTIKRKEK